ncbi:hypothetical protein [Enterococcus sp. DIV2371]
MKRVSWYWQSLFDCLDFLTLFVVSQTPVKRQSTPSSELELE